MGLDAPHFLDSSAKKAYACPVFPIPLCSCYKPHRAAHSRHPERRHLQVAARGSEWPRSDLQAPVPRASREQQRAGSWQAVPPGVQQPSALTRQPEGFASGPHQHWRQLWERKTSTKRLVKCPLNCHSSRGAAGAKLLVERRGRSWPTAPLPSQVPPLSPWDVWSVLLLNEPAEGSSACLFTF